MKILVLLSLIMSLNIGYAKRTHRGCELDCRKSMNKARLEGFAVGSKRLEKSGIIVSRVNIYEKSENPAPGLNGDPLGLDLVALHMGIPNWAANSRGAFMYQLNDFSTQILVSEMYVDSRDMAVDVCETLDAQLLPVDQYNFYLSPILKRADSLASMLTVEGYYQKKRMSKFKYFNYGIAGWNPGNNEGGKEYKIILSRKAIEKNEEYKERKLNRLDFNDVKMLPAVCIRNFEINEIQSHDSNRNTHDIAEERSVIHETESFSNGSIRE